MRTKEGVGRVAPHPERVTLSDADLATARRLAWERVAARGYDRRADEWGYGYLGPWFANYAGFAGEIAFANWVARRLGLVVPVDSGYRPGGDGGVDFRLCGYGVQVKTAYTPYDVLLVRTRDAVAPADEGPLVSWDVCVRVQWPPRASRSSGRGLFADGERADRNAADLCGVVWRADFKDVARIEPGRGSGEWNYAVRPTDFLPLRTLEDKCLARLMRSERDAS